MGKSLFAASLGVISYSMSVLEYPDRGVVEERSGMGRGAEDMAEKLPLPLAQREECHYPMRLRV